MDQFLDAMYGTRENIGATTDISVLEKNAEAELLIDALQKEGWDVDQIDNLSGEDVLKVAHALFGENSALLKEAQLPPALAEKAEEMKEEKEEEKGEEKEEKKEETAEEKVAEADKLGRQMAHAFVDEMAQLEKAAQYEQVKQAKAEQAATAMQRISGQPQTPAERMVSKVASAGQEPTEADLEAYIEQMANEKIAAMQLTPEQQLEALIEQRVQEKLAGQRPFQQA
jgi:hypothetical protein